MTDHEALAYRLFELRTRIVSEFNAENWEEVGLLTKSTDLITGHPRLLRSLAWNDEDYGGNVLTVLREISDRSPAALDVIEKYLDRKFPGGSTYISAKPSERKITFAPHVFSVPDLELQPDLVAAMMPFAAEFDPVYEAIKAASARCDLRCLRVDDLWEETTIIQEVFNLVFRAQVVVVDFSGKNPNVMYETGIAHTLGKHVVPITQSIQDVPFDVRHHRVLTYHPNAQGLEMLSAVLATKLEQFGSKPRVEPTPAIEASGVDFDTPF